MIFKYIFKGREDTIDTDDFPNGFGFLGANAEEDIVGFAIIRAEENGKIGVYGIDVDGRFNQGQEDVLDWIDENVSWLVRDNLRLDEQSAGVELIPTEDYEFDHNNAATYIPNGFIKSCRIIKEEQPEGGGGGGGGGGGDNPNMYNTSVKLEYRSGQKGYLPDWVLEDDANGSLAANYVESFTWRGSFSVGTNNIDELALRASGPFLIGALRSFYNTVRAYLISKAEELHFARGGREGWEIDVVGPQVLRMSDNYNNVYTDGDVLPNIAYYSYLTISEAYNVIDSDGNIDSSVYYISLPSMRFSP